MVGKIRLLLLVLGCLSSLALSAQTHDSLAIIPQDPIKPSIYVPEPGNAGSAPESVRLIVPLLDIRIFVWEPHPMVKAGKVEQLDSLSLAAAAMGTTADLLQAMPSISSKRYAPGGLATPSFRGTGAGHTQVYWMGLPLNSPGLGQQDLSLNAGGLFSGVALLYGGSSLLLGSGGLGGAINLQSSISMPSYHRLGLKVHQQVGSWRNTSTSAGLNYYVGNQVRMRTELYWNSGRNDFKFADPSLPNDAKRRLQNAGILQLGGMHQANFTLKQYIFGAHVWAFDSERFLPPTLQTINNLERQHDQAVRSSFQVNRIVRRSMVGLQGAYFKEYMAYENPTAQIFSETAFNRWIGLADFSGQPVEKGFQFKYAQLRYVHDQAQSDGFAAPVNWGQLSGMGQVEYGIKNRLFFDMILRQELNDTKLSPILGMLGSQFRLPERGLSVNLSAARNYRYPTLNDRYWFPGGNPDLRPELSQSVEGNLTFSKSRIENSLVLTLGGYYNHVRDWILWVPSNTAIWRPENVQTVNAKGFEANFKASHQMRSIYIYLVGNYNLSHTQDQDGQQLIYTPRHNAFGRLMLRKGAWNVQYSQDWNSRRYTVVDNSAWLKGFTTADLSLGWKLPQPEVLDGFGVRDSRSGPKDRMGLQVQLGMRNIWNLQYQTVASRPMPGRSVFVRLDWDLEAKGRW